MALFSVLLVFMRLTFILVILTASVQGSIYPSNGAVKFYQQGVCASSSFTSGIVQVFIDGAWGNICAGNGFGLEEANVVCHQFHYAGASSVNRASQSRYGIDPSSTAISDVTCSSSDYQVILQCSYNTTIAASCTDDDDIAVTCYSSRIWDSPFEGQVRLINASSVSSGHLEIYCNSQWGAVCSDYFNRKAAMTVCIQLGYNAVEAWHASIRSSAHPVWLDRATCPTFEQCLRRCQACPQDGSSYECAHSDDVYIQCKYNTNSAVIGSKLKTCSYVHETDELPEDLGLKVALILLGILMLIFTTCLCVCICLWCLAGSSQDNMEPDTIDEFVSYDHEIEEEAESSPHPLAIFMPNVSQPSSICEEQEIAPADGANESSGPGSEDQETPLSDMQ